MRRTTADVITDLNENELFKLDVSRIFVASQIHFSEFSFGFQKRDLDSMKTARVKMRC